MLRIKKVVKKCYCLDLSAHLIRTVILISLNRKMPIREFYLDRILAELELSHDEVSFVSSVIKSYVTGLALRAVTLNICYG